MIILLRDARNANSTPYHEGLFRGTQFLMWVTVLLVSKFGNWFGTFCNRILCFWWIMKPFLAIPFLQIAFSSHEVMGYCIPCFGSSKHRKSLNKTHVQVPSGNQRHETCETRQPTKAAWQEVEKKIEPIVDSKNKHEEKSVGIVVIKKVTFDLNVRAHEELPTQEVKNRSVELKNGEENGNKKEATQDESQARSDSDDDDGESEAMEFLESDSDDNQESDSLFSISIESRNQISAPEIDEKEVNSPIPVRCLPECELKSIGSNQNERRKDLGSVLNPVENLTQWRASKSAKPTPSSKDQEKENIDTGEVLAIIAFGEGPHLKSSNGDFKRRFERSKPEVDDVAVDTSLSSWLVESETASILKNSTPNNSVGNSPGRVNLSRRFEDRRILEQVYQ